MESEWLTPRRNDGVLELWVSQEQYRLRASSESNRGGAVGEPLILVFESMPCSSRHQTQ